MEVATAVEAVATVAEATNKVEATNRVEATLAAAAATKKLCVYLFCNVKEPF